MRAWDCREALVKPVQRQPLARSAHRVAGVRFIRPAAFAGFIYRVALAGFI
jgi:hypothetical protein